MIKKQLLKAARALHAGGEAIESYVKQLEKKGFDFDNTTMLSANAAADTAMWLSSKRVDQVLGEGD